MKLAKFYFKYYLTRSLRKKSHIENVIRSQGFSIYRFDPQDPTDDVAQLMHSCKCWNHIQGRPSFLYLKGDEKYLFLKKGFSHDDQLILLFHEEAHIWYNHPFRSGLIDDSAIQHEQVANLFLPRLRILKKVTTLLVLALLAAGVFFFLLRPSKPVAEPAPTVETVQPADELPAQQGTDDTVYITTYGNAYHREYCGTIVGCRLTVTTRVAAENIGRHRCSYCLP